MQCMKTRRAGVILGFLLMFSCHTAFADVVQGTFTFQQTVAHVALIYFPEDTSLTPNGDVVIDQANKVFSPTLIVAGKGAKIVFKNSDAIKHNMFGRSRKTNIKFNLGFIKPAEQASYTVGWENHVVKVGCRIHPQMRMWIASISSKYYKVIEFPRGEKTFAFEMKDIPADLSKVKLWISGYPPMDVSIKHGEQKQVELYNWGDTSDTLTLVRK